MTDHHKEDGLTFQLDEPGRYRLYAFKVCPFAHRVRLVRLLQPGLADAIQVTFASDQTIENGIVFDPPEPEFQATCLKDVYGKCCSSDYSGKFSVPLVIDRTTHKMVHNESMDLALALAWGSSPSTLLPEGAEALAKELAGSITLAPYKYLIADDATQKQEIANSLWSELDKYETLLGIQDYLLADNSNQPSLADCILWISLIRHDNVYARMFGLNAKTIQRDYPNLTRFVKRLWKTPCANNNKTDDKTLGDDVDMKELVRLYWQSPVLAPKAGHDPTAPVPEALPVF